MKQLSTLALLLIAVQMVVAQFSLEAVMSSPFPSNLTAAKKANQIAWVYNHKGVRNIWTASATQQAWQPQKVTDFTLDDGQAISNLILKENSKEIIFVYGGAPNRRGEMPNPTSHPDGAKRLILKISAAGGEIDTLAMGSAPTMNASGSQLAFLQKGQVWFYDFETSKAQSAFTIRGSAGNLRWSPDGSKLAFTSSRGDHAFVGIYDVTTHSIHYLSPSVDRDSNPVWSPDGKQLAFLRIPNEKNQLIFVPRRTALPWSIWVHNLESGDTRAIWKAPTGKGSAFRSVSAQNQLMWLASDHLVFPYEGNGWTNLWTITSEGTGLRNLTPGEFEVQFVSVSADQKSVFYSGNQGDIDRQHIWQTSPTQTVVNQITKTEGIEWSPVQTTNGKLFCLGSSGISPAQLMTSNGKELTAMTPKAFLQDFPNNELVQPEQIIFSAADGMSIHGQLFLPKNYVATKKYPAVLFFHGGSRRQMLLGFHHRGYYHNAYSMNQYLASQGYIVLSINYRSGIGYGMEFREALNYGANGASEFLDVMGAGLYLRSRSDVEPTKIGLWGGSYGGYLTALGLAKASDLFAAGVDIHGVHDWNVVINNFIPSYAPNDRPDFADLAYQSSPMPYVKDWKSPVLLIHGDDDRNVPFSETVDLVEALRENEVYFEQLIFPDEVHGFLLHRNWLRAYRAAADFFNRMLKEEK